MTESSESRGDSESRVIRRAVLGAGLLPKHSLFSLEEYLDMQRAIGNEIRFRILHFLTEKGAHSAKELEQGKPPVEHAPLPPGGSCCTGRYRGG